MKLPIELHVREGGPAENREDASGITKLFLAHFKLTNTADGLKSLGKITQSIKGRLKKLLSSLKSRLEKFILP